MTDTSSPMQQYRNDLWPVHQAVHLVPQRWSTLYNALVKDTKFATTEDGWRDFIQCYTMQHVRQQSSACRSSLYTMFDMPPAVPVSNDGSFFTESPVRGLPLRQYTQLVATLKYLSSFQSCNYGVFVQTTKSTGYVATAKYDDIDEWFCLQFNYKRQKSAQWRILYIDPLPPHPLPSSVPYDSVFRDHTHRRICINPRKADRFKLMPHTYISPVLASSLMRARIRTCNRPHPVHHRRGGNTRCGTLTGNILQTLKNPPPVHDLLHDAAKQLQVIHLKSKQRQLQSILQDSIKHQQESQAAEQKARDKMMFFKILKDSDDAEIRAKWQGDDITDQYTRARQEHRLSVMKLAASIANKKSAASNMAAVDE